MAICCLANVSGKVQGVYFRASCQQMAIDLQLSGYAKNLADGDVQVLVCGEEDNVNKMLEWLKEGPSQAEVANVTHNQVEYQSLNHFSIG
ncbi:acylphosphatase [Thalassotalea euphylliae]|uniref:Acylphosphatase n=1 Tax=Thalassotalea euphylliae TaxID=1655234 RepID=A0A3E0TY45_9GAMM|nr:acylphosphatase [Thalassotalea euphylliae]REL29566.1 acylphosphatase [Thalassotalea euphylliae]